jgi:hypothetical protein
MKKNQHITFLFLFFASIFCNQAMSQDDHFVYAITSLQKSGTDWVCLRKLNTETNQFTTIMMNDADNDKAAIILMYGGFTASMKLFSLREHFKNCFHSFFSCLCFFCSLQPPCNGIFVSAVQ